MFPLAVVSSLESVNFPIPKYSHPAHKKKPPQRFFQRPIEVRQTIQDALPAEAAQLVAALCPAPLGLAAAGREPFLPSWRAVTGSY
jgi:hypothetical protein